MNTFDRDKSFPSNRMNKSLVPMFFIWLSVCSVSLHWGSVKFHHQSFTPAVVRLLDIELPFRAQNATSKFRIQLGKQLKIIWRGWEHTSKDLILLSHPLEFYLAFCGCQVTARRKIVTKAIECSGARQHVTSAISQNNNNKKTPHNQSCLVSVILKRVNCGLFNRQADKQSQFCTSVGRSQSETQQRMS